MIDQEQLSAFAESYLKSLIAQASSSLDADFDSFAPFGELGIDSFRVLKIIKALEADFGTLPKTLLFENFNINDLARYFVDKHAGTLSAKLALGRPALPPNKAVATTVPAIAVAVKVAAAQPAAGAQPILVLEKDAWTDPALGKLVKEVFDRYKNDGSVSRGARCIAPNLFIGSERKGFFHYARCKNVIVAYTYTGPRAYFPSVARELHAHCEKLGLELNLLTADELSIVEDVRFSSTPFGVLQRVTNLQAFTLDGPAMRRLRYQVSKFEKAGRCSTVEFRCGSDAAMAQRIAEVIDLWCSGRSMVNPLIHIVKDEIVAGTLDPDHRIFLTSLDDVLQNVILMSPLCAELDGYLMDLEFYSGDMPLGGLEYAIVNIIRVLVAEGHSVLSMGGTYGCKLEASANADPEVDRILDDLRMQHIFNDEGNLQFKNKFRPENRTIYLCRPTGRGNPDSVVDVIMMIADPLRMQTSDEENHNFGKPAAAGVAFGNVARPAAGDAIVGIEGVERSFALALSGFNPLNLRHDRVAVDLKTDSWAQLHLPAIENQRRYLHARLEAPADLESALRAIFPFRHFVLTTSGRTAEGVFCKAWPRRGVVPQNLLFPTTIFHQIDKGYSPRELPHPDVFRVDSLEPYKGNLDVAALQALLESDAGAVPFVCIETSNNASGGHPVSFAHLQDVRALLDRHGIALVLDATRILENAQFLIERDAEHAGQSVWQVARALLGQAHAVVVSLAKDFCVSGGGLIATNDATLFHKLQQAAVEDACTLGAIDRKLLALSLQDTAHLETQSRCRRDAVGRIWQGFVQHGVPVVKPAGGHCILVDVKRIPEFAPLPYPVASFVAWLYLATGIRAGAHNAGMQKDSALNGLVRFAVPIGLGAERVDDIVDRVAVAFADKKNIPEIEPVDGAAGPLGDIHARYRLIGYHSPSAPLVGRTPTADAHGVAPANAVAPPSATQPAAQRPGAPAPRDIAIVGMAGRYPKARNLSELWDNLLGGVDCVDEIPEARLAERLHNDFTRRYRGGFIDDVDKFDARFFGIVDRDAAIMDPQERLFLEVACEAVEDAGYYPEILGDEANRQVGVFVGVVWSSYQMLGAEEKIAGNNINPSSFQWSIANRVSYWMNLCGPSLALDTACSASLTAIKLACDAINNGDCTAAIAGGVTLDLHQSKFDINATGGSLSRTGACRSYGRDADGYVSGEGVGALLLKPLAQAIADGDQIHGVIKSAVATHSGRTSAYTIPNPRTQTDLVLKALAQARIDARTIGYVEGHGTGTEFGDSIEIAALTAAFAEHGANRQGCAIGCVKTNIGHLEAASGIVGIQKILLQMKHRKLVPSLHSRELNENIDFANSPFRVQQSVAEWEAKEVDGIRLPRRAAVSAIGIGGANAHVVVEEYAAPATEEIRPEGDARIFPLSARTEEQLREAAVRLREFLARCLAPGATAPHPHADDVAFTLAFGRKSFDRRLAIVARGLPELADKLDAFLAGAIADDVMHGNVKNANGVVGLLNAREKRDFVDLLVRRREPRRLAHLWSEGVIADWQGLDYGQSGRRISLPTYPFARERHWIVDRKPATPLAATARPDTGSPAPATLRNDVRGAAAKPLERYLFAFVGGEQGERSGPALSAEEKARLFVRQMFADQLGVSVHDTPEDTPLMETGVTSLDMAAMTQVLKDRFDQAFSPTAFFECNTLAAFADALVRKFEGAFSTMVLTKAISEEEASASRRPAAQGAAGRQAAETSYLPLHALDAQAPLVLPGNVGVAPPHRGRAGCVLLTGASGFLGIHLLSEYLAADPDARVRCLVRATDAEHARQRLRLQAAKYELALDESRVSVLCGDIELPRLGLAEDEWEACCCETDQIVHAGAHVNHMEGYASFRESTAGMKEIVRLAGRRRMKLIQFVSSTAACFQKVGNEFRLFDEEAFIPEGLSVYGGYGQSKWVQETFLRRAHEAGVPFAIHRFGELSGSSRSGLGQTDDMLHRLLQMRLAIGCREKISSDVLDIVPVDHAARLIVGTGNTPVLWNRIFHATHPKPWSFANLYRRAQRLGLQFDPVTREHYLAKCHDFVKYLYAVHPVDGFVLECMLRDAEGSVRKRKVMDGYFAVLFPFAQDNFRHALQTLGIALPDWAQLMDRYAQRWSRDDCGFLARIHEYRQWVRTDGGAESVPEAAVLEDLSEA